jgi:hypothetical protein
MLSIEGKTALDIVLELRDKQIEQGLLQRTQKYNLIETVIILKKEVVVLRLDEELKKTLTQMQNHYGVGAKSAYTRYVLHNFPHLVAYWYKRACDIELTPEEERHLEWIFDCHLETYAPGRNKMNK